MSSWINNLQAHNQLRPIMITLTCNNLRLIPFPFTASNMIKPQEPAKLAPTEVSWTNTEYVKHVSQHAQSVIREEHANRAQLDLTGNPTNTLLNKETLLDYHTPEEMVDANLVPM